jgi:hypothetical protein
VFKMPLPKRQTLPSKAKPTEDTRFSSFQSDAKYRLPAKKHSKTQLDSRFSRLLTDPDFYNKASVDRYGRKIDKSAGKKKLEKLYTAEEDEDEEDRSELNTEGARRRDDAVKRELAKVDIRGRGHDFIREGGLSSSSDESSSDEEEDEEEEVVEEQAELAEQGSEVPTGEVTARLAAVNMDWDNIRAMDIMAVANSFVPADGRIRSVVIYPSEFGMERMQREDIEGPPREIFASSSARNKNNITSVDDLGRAGSGDEGEPEADVGDGEEFDSRALRQYQLDRLRYYYAVLTCSSPETAKSIYDNLDGREYLSSANFFDLRFVPDEVTFDTDPHDECEDLPDGYKPNEFQTTALTHSKVKLTWDAEDTTRKEVQKRAFSQKEIDENELQAYIGSESEDEPEDAEKTAALRAALGLGPSDGGPKSSQKRDRDFKKPAGDMEITFSAGLSTSAAKGGVFENEPIIEETTIEKYVRKQRERKQKRKERAKALQEGRDPDAEEVGKSKHEKTKTDEDEDDPWNDPFFDVDPDSAPISSKAESKKSKKARKREQEEDEQKNATERANLELLMVDDEDSNVRHFDMNEIMKAEKAKKKGKKKTKGETAAVDDGFNIDTNDPRFARLYESHEFAIDPTNPRFRATSGMKALLEEGRKKRKRDRDDGTGFDDPKKRKSKEQDVGDVEDLKKLAARVKAKSAKV